MERQWKMKENQGVDIEPPCPFSMGSDASVRNAHFLPGQVFYTMSQGPTGSA
jgi:hypothetical protein